MIASDIPEGYATATSMARSLATYIDCPHEINRRVKSVFARAPSVYECRQMRAKFLQPDHREPLRHNNGYYPGEASAELAVINELFVRRLEAERCASRAADRQALASNYLTNPELVNLRFESEVATARIDALESRRGAA